MLNLIEMDIARNSCNTMQIPKKDSLISISAKIKFSQNFEKFLNFRFLNQPVCFLI